jgi:hypothetical protein
MAVQVEREKEKKEYPKEFSWGSAQPMIGSGSPALRWQGSSTMRGVKLLD